MCPHRLLLPCEKQRLLSLLLLLLQLLVVKVTCQPLNPHSNVQPEGLSSDIYYRAMHYNAKRGLAIACRLSFRLTVTVDHDHIG